MPTENSDDETSTESTPLASQAVRRLLERHGIGERQQVSYIVDKLGITTQQSRRRMNGSSPWTVEELHALTLRLGETLSSLFAERPDSLAPEAHEAVFITGNLRLDCLAWIGEETAKAAAGPLVAARPSGGGWVVLPPADAPGTLHRVDRVMLLLQSSNAPRVAVLDDDRDLANTIAEYLTKRGLNGKAFFEPAELARAIEEQPFDGYVLDWLFNRKETARELIASIRARDPNCPVLVLTGQLDKGLVSEADMSALASAFNVAFLEKGIRPSSILSTLQTLFARQEPA